MSIQEGNTGLLDGTGPRYSSFAVDDEPISRSSSVSADVEVRADPDVTAKVGQHAQKMDTIEAEFPVKMAVFKVLDDPHPFSTDETFCDKNCSCCSVTFSTISQITTDCCSCSNNRSMVLRRTKSQLFWLFTLLALGYGFSAWIRSYNWTLSQLIDSKAGQGFWLGCARAAGTMITISTMTLLISMNRILTNSVNELPNYRRDWFFWRQAHKTMAGLVFIFGLFHTIAHTIRQEITYGIGEGIGLSRWNVTREVCNVSGGGSFRVPNNGVFGYEIWSLLSGYGLWLCLIGLGLHHFLLKLPRVFCKPRRDPFPCDATMKVFFRKFHVPIYYLYTLLYMGHTYNLWPFLFIIMYKLSYFLYQLPITGAMYCFNVKGKRTHFTTEAQYDLELWFHLAHDIPAQFGLYCQVQIDNITSSYTVIPDQENSHIIHFKIRKSSITEKFRKMVGADLKNMHYTGGGSSNENANSEGASSFNPELYNINVFGPFHSSDLELANSKKLCVLTTGIGGTVAYSTIAYARGRPNHWENLTIVHYDRDFDASSEAIRMGVSEEQAAAKTTCKTMEELVNFSLTGDAKKATLEPETKSGSKSGRKKKRVESVAPTFISLNGRLNAGFTRDLIAGLHAKGYDFLVCSKIWTDLIEQVNEFQPFRGDVVKSLHIEEFD